MKTRQPDHSAYSVEYVEYDPITIVIAMVSVLITVLHRNLWPTQSTSSTSTTQDSTGTLIAIPEQAQPDTGSTNTDSIKSGKAKSRPRSQSTKSGRTTEAQKKVAGGTRKVNQSTEWTETNQRSASSARSKPSEKPSNSPGDGTCTDNQPLLTPENVVPLKSTFQTVTPSTTLKNVLVMSD
mgnify:CR=1 FL=1